jgi:hypothetical protein
VLEKGDFVRWQGFTLTPALSREGEGVKFLLARGRVRVGVYIIKYLISS